MVKEDATFNSIGNVYVNLALNANIKEQEAIKEIHEITYAKILS